MLCELCNNGVNLLYRAKVGNDYLLICNDCLIKEARKDEQSLRLFYLRIAEKPDVHINSHQRGRENHLLALQEGA